MRKTNWRSILGGFVLLIFAVSFYFFMLSIAPQSTDPAVVMQTTGTVSGVSSGISLALIIFGFIGKKVWVIENRHKIKCLFRGVLFYLFVNQFKSRRPAA